MELQPLACDLYHSCNIKVSIVGRAEWKFSNSIRERKKERETENIILIGKINLLVGNCLAGQVCVLVLVILSHSLSE